MPTFTYLAGEPGKPERNITVEADSRADSAAKLRRMGFVPIRLVGENISDDLPAGHGKIDVNSFTRELAVLLKNHVAIEKALALISESADAPAQKEFVNSLRQGLHEGRRFSELVRRHGRVFPGFYANIVESGEESGCLAQAVERLNSFMDESRELKEFIISSSIYPAVILGVCLAMMVVLFVWFVPKFADVFAQMGRELPGAMKFLTVLGAILSYAWWLVPLAGFAAWRIMKKTMGAERMEEWRGRTLTKLPVFGKIAIQLEMCRFLRTLAILVENHVEIIRTVRLSTGVIRHAAIRRSFADVEGKLRSGLKLSAALSGNPYLPSGAAAMIRMGEESGEVSEMISGVAERLEETTRAKIKRLLSLFEPVVIVALAAVILVVVGAIFMSIMEMNAINA
ncbi:MAG: type II secretion system F family protein [Victivallaceae bacterium]|nr:type II secretion system F family protein [Victivallaceae bacterium]